MRRVTIMYVLYVAVLGALAAYRWEIWSFGADTGTFTQVALNAFDGFRDTSELGSHFHVHWAPLLVVLYPFAALTHSGLAIQLVQIVAIGLGVFPLFAFLRRYFDEAFAATLAGIMLLYPPLLAVSFDEFHEIAFYSALVFALLWAIDAGRRGWMAVFGVLLLLVREEAIIVVAIFGALLALAAARPTRATPRGLLFWEPADRAASIALGVSLAIVGPIVVALYFNVVAPSLGGWTAAHYYSYPFAHGPFHLVAAIVTRPLDVFRAVATPGRASYLLEALAPLLFLPLFSRWMFAAIPGLAVVLLSSDAIAWRMGSHYAAIWVPWLLIATADTLARIARTPATATRARRLTSGVVVACAIVLIAFDPLHPIHYLRPPYPDLADARRAFETVPVAASVYTHDEWFARVAGLWPESEHIWNEPEYVVLANDFPHPERFAPFMQSEVRHGCYGVVHRFDAVVVYRRTNIAVTSPACRIPRGA